MYIEACGSVLVKALRRTVSGSIPGDVTGFFSDIFPSIALGSTQLVLEMSTRNITWGKGGLPPYWGSLRPRTLWAYTA